MCLAVPVAALLLVVFAGLTVLRLSGPVSPNATHLAELLDEAPQQRSSNEDRPATKAAPTVRPA